MDFSDVSERVTHIRENSGLNQDAFAKRLGLTKSAISGYETGRRIPPDAVVKSIAREFAVSEEWIKTGNGSPEVCEQDGVLGKVFSEYHCSDLERMIIRSYFQLTESERRQFCKYLGQVFGGSIPALEPLPETPEQKAARLERENREQADRIAALEKELTSLEGGSTEAV